MLSIQKEYSKNIIDKSSQYNVAKSFFLLLGIVSLASIILFFHAKYYMKDLGFISDDALISLRYAKRLLQGHGLTWTDGRPVEGYSNLLWILLVSLPGSMGLNLIDSVRALGFFFNALSIGAIAYITYDKNIRQFLAPLIGTLTIAFSGCYAVWTIGGLEQPLVACLVAFSIAFALHIHKDTIGVYKYIIATSICLALLCITRPDGIIFTFSIVFWVFLTKGFNYHNLILNVKLAFPSILFYLGQLVFRIIYYGEWVPNTALCKLSPSWLHFTQGLKYIGKGFISFSPLSELSMLIGISLLFSHSRRPKILLLFIISLIWSGYVAFVGGDIFPAYRHFVPIVICMALIIVQGLEWFKKHCQRKLFYCFTMLLFPIFLGWFMYGQIHDSQNKRALLERWEWRGKSKGLMLKKGFGSSQPLIAVNSAGALPYWSELPAIDMLGLNDYYIPRHPPEDFGQRFLGHELGDGRYVLKRKPDLVILGGKGGTKGHFLSGRQIQNDPKFDELYTLVKFKAWKPVPVRPKIWVRKNSKKVGIQRSDEDIFIPSYLLNGNPRTHAYLNESGEFVIPILPKQPAIINNISVPSGNWELSVDSSSSVYVKIQISNLFLQVLKLL